MSTALRVAKQKSGQIRNSNLILFAFTTAFFPRIIESIGAPAAINFLHFVVVPTVCGIVIFTTKVKDKSQISTAKAILTSIFILLIVMAASALLNQAGVINIFLHFMLLIEPFLLLLAIICVRFSAESLTKFKAWMFGFFGVHIFLALAQHFLITIRLLRVTSMQPPDNVQGVFYLTGSGHVVGVSVAMSFVLYYLISNKTAPLWLRGSVFFAAFLQLLFADAKQVLLVWFVAWLLLIVTRLKNIKVFLQYLIAITLIGYLFFWCIENVAAFSAFKTWIRPEIYGPDGEATLLKSSPFRIIPSYYESPLNWLLGLGPGHTIGRLGGWMLASYGSLLQPLGATTHPASGAVWDFWSNNYAWLDSSFFAPLWGWAGIWGDLGFLGLGAYLYIGFIIWHRICLDDFSRFQILTVIVFGFIFTQMEEPGYMLSVASLIGLAWQERHMIKVARQDSSYWNSVYANSMRGIS